jgi:lipopolysaccharide cholinephosphotransferase
MDSSSGRQAGKFRRLFKKRPLSAYSDYARKSLGVRMMPADVALRNLVDIARVFDSRGCQYSLTAGTLLGAIRNGDFIRHDPDTDLAVPAETFDPFVLRDLHDEGFRITRGLGFPDDGMELTLDRDGVKTDLFLLYPREETTYFSAYNDFTDATARWIDYGFPRFEYGWLDFKGHRFQAPTTPEVFLRCFYGESWRTPVKHWNYAVDPPNARPRSDRLDVRESHRAISEFLFRETGARLL